MVGAWMVCVWAGQEDGCSSEHVYRWVGWQLGLNGTGPGTADADHSSAVDHRAEHSPQLPLPFSKQATTLGASLVTLT